MLAFADLVLDPDRGCLMRNGQPVPLRPKAYALLQHFSRNPGRLIAKSELIGTVWKRVAVSDDSIAQCVKEVRSALGRDARDLLRTVPRRGYLFEAPRPAAAALSLAVLCSPTARRLAGELTLGLSRVPQSSVVCRPTAAVYDPVPDPRDAARELGVRHVVHVVLGRGVATVTLVDGHSGRQLWAERYERPTAQLGRMTLDLHTRLIEAASDDRVMRAWALWNRQVSEANRQAQTLLQEALAEDSSSVLGWITLANTHLAAISHRWTRSRRSSLIQAAAATDRALALDARHPNVHGTHSVVLYWQGRFEESLAASRRQIEHNPNYALGHYWLGLALIASGRPRDSLAPLHRTIELSPKDARIAGFCGAVALAHMNLGHRKETISWARRALLERPASAAAEALLASAYALSGERAQARRHLARFRAAFPKHTLRSMQAQEPLREPLYREQRRTFYDGLRRAGLPRG